MEVHTRTANLLAGNTTTNHYQTGKGLRKLRLFLFFANKTDCFMEVIVMKKLILEFWHIFFSFGDLLSTVGDYMVDKGMEKMENLIRNDLFFKQYAKKRGMIR